MTSSFASIGLGLAMPLAHLSAGRRCISVSSSYSASIDGLSDGEEEDSMSFPLPPASLEQSYWSPSTVDSDEEAHTPEQSFVAHPALHLLSPKAQAMAEVAVQLGMDEAVDGALSFGWLASVIEDGHPPAPLPSRRPRLDSVVTSPASSSSSAPSLHRAFSRMSGVSNSTRATSLHSGIKSPRESAKCFRSVSESRSTRSRVASSNLAKTVASEQDPRAALLKIWLEAEAVQQSRNRPLPPLPASEAKNGKVKAWLGGLRRPSSQASLVDAKRVMVREPRVHRTASIEQILCEA